MKKYHTIVIITVLLYLISVIMYFANPGDYPLINWFFAGFFALFSTVFIYILYRTMIMKPRAFVRRFMALSGFKFLAGIIFLALALWLIKDYKIFTALHFLIIFIVYLFLEVFLLLSYLKKNTSKKDA